MIAYRHIRRTIFDSPDTPEYTIAAELRGDQYHIGIATCSPRDMYCRATGREIARSRLYSDTQLITLDDLTADFPSGKNSIFTAEADAMFLDNTTIKDFSIHHILSFAQLRSLQNQGR